MSDDVLCRRCRRPTPSCERHCYRDSCEDCWVEVHVVEHVDLFPVYAWTAVEQEMVDAFAVHNRKLEMSRRDRGLPAILARILPSRGRRKSSHVMGSA